jgi:hypothetical protein
MWFKNGLIMLLWCEVRSYRSQSDFIQRDVMSFLLFRMWGFFGGSRRLVFDDYCGTLVARCVGKRFNAIDSNEAVNIGSCKGASKAENKSQRLNEQTVRPGHESENNKTLVCQFCLLFAIFSDT